MYAEGYKPAVEEVLEELEQGNEVQIPADMLDEIIEIALEDGNEIEIVDNEENEDSEYLTVYDNIIMTVNEDVLEDVKSFGIEPRFVLVNLTVIVTQGSIGQGLPILPIEGVTLILECQVDGWTQTSVTNANGEAVFMSLMSTGTFVITGSHPTNCGTGFTTFGPWTDWGGDGSVTATATTALSLSSEMLCLTCRACAICEEMPGGIWIGGINSEGNSCRRCNDCCDCLPLYQCSDFCPGGCGVCLNCGVCSCPPVYVCKELCPDCDECLNCSECICPPPYECTQLCPDCGKCTNCGVCVCEEPEPQPQPEPQPEPKPEGRAPQTSDNIEGLLTYLVSAWISSAVLLVGTRYKLKRKRLK